MRREADGFFPFFKAFSWETDLSITLVDYEKKKPEKKQNKTKQNKKQTNKQTKTRKVGRKEGKPELSENRLSNKRMWYAAEKNTIIRGTRVQKDF